MAARDKNIFSKLYSELNPGDSDDDDESTAFSKDEYVPSDEQIQKMNILRRTFIIEKNLN